MYIIHDIHTMYMRYTMYILYLRTETSLILVSLNFRGTDIENAPHETWIPIGTSVVLI